jgi:hypothetical protein
MERFTGFSGFQPSLLHDPHDRLVKGGFRRLFGGDIAGADTREAGIDGWDTGPAREFFFSACPVFKKNLTSFVQQKLN